MSSYAQSKIVTARKPARGASYPCAACGAAIYSGDQVFRYQIGQRTSLAFCLVCIRGSHLHVDPDIADLKAARLIYLTKYGPIRWMICDVEQIAGVERILPCWRYADQPHLWRPLAELPAEDERHGPVFFRRPASRCTVNFVRPRYR